MPEQLKLNLLSLIFLICLNQPSFAQTEPINRNGIGADISDKIIFKVDRDGFFSEHSDLLHYRHRVLTFASWFNARNGRFRRALDPQVRNSAFIFAETILPLSDSSSVFRGYLQYYNEDLKKVHGALEYILIETFLLPWTPLWEILISSDRLSDFNIQGEFLSNFLCASA